jgi:hypothetical protein
MQEDCASQMTLPASMLPETSQNVSLIGKKSICVYPTRVQSISEKMQAMLQAVGEPG